MHFDEDQLVAQFSICINRNYGKMNKNLYDDSMLQWAGRNDHSGSIDHPDRQATKSNPLCGDRVTVQLIMENDVIKQIYYQLMPG